MKRTARPRTGRTAGPVSIQKNILYNTIGSLTYQGCLWLVTVLVVVLSRGYGSSGMLSYAMSVGNMFVPIATFSLRSYQVSDVQGRFSQSNYVGFRLVTICLSFAIIIPYSSLVTNDASTLAAVVLFLLFKTDESFCDVLYGVDQRAERMDYVGISQFLRGLLLVAGFSTCLVVFDSLYAALLGMTLPCLCITLFYDLPHAARYDCLKPHLTKAVAISLLHDSLPIVLSTLFLGMVVSVARQYYGNTFGMESLGRYAAVATPAVLIQAGARYLYGPTLVPLAKHWHEDPAGTFLDYLRKTVALILLGCAAFVVTLSLLGEPLLTFVYGAGIAPYVSLFPWVLVSTAITALMWFLNDMLTICRDMRDLLVANTTSLLVSLVLLVPMESTFEMDGINYVVILATAIGVALDLLFLRHNILAAMRERLKANQGCSHDRGGGVGL